MPINCPIQFPRLNDVQMKEIDYAVMSHAFAVQTELGPLCDEPVYQAALHYRLKAADIASEIELPVKLTFGDFETTLRIDLVVNNQVPYELKAVSRLTQQHENQLLNYMLLTNCARGKVINFRPESVASRFINSPLETVDRFNFEIDATHWHGDSSFLELLSTLVNDWGTCIDVSLYSQAITHVLGGEDKVVQQIPMHDGDSPIGSQRFRMFGGRAAFRITTYPKGVTATHVNHLKKLINPSPLGHLYLVNIGRHRVQFLTIDQDQPEGGKHRGRAAAKAAVTQLAGMSESR